MDTTPHNPTILTFPREVLVMIFSLLPDPRDARSVMLSCKDLHAVAKTFEGTISLSILHRGFDPEHLPMAVARYMAETAPWKQPKRRKEFTKEIAATYEDKIVAFCEQYIRRRPDTKVLESCDSTLAMAHGILSFHAPVEKMSRFYGRAIDDPVAFCAGRNAKRNEQQAHPMTPSELMRVEKAFYIIDIVHQLFPLRPKNERGEIKAESGQHDRAFTRFWRYFAPWENCQVYVITDWIRISMNIIFRGNYFKRMVYREDPHPQDYRTQVLVLLGVPAMDAIVLRGRYKGMMYQTAIDRNYLDFLRREYRRSTYTFDRSFFDQEAIEGKVDASLEQSSYLKYDPGQDTGPRDVWLYGQGWTRQAGSLGGQLRQLLGSDPMGPTKLNIAVFWDRDRVNRNFQGLFPTHDEMVEAAKRDSIYIPLIR